MNRTVIQESAAAELSPTDLVDLALQTGFDSIGLKVAHSRGADLWWRKGAGSAELGSMVEHLLTNRVSVLDVGRIELGGPPNDESYRGVLDLSSRLGARYVTAGGVGSGQQLTQLQEEFGRLVADCEDYQLIPLLVAATGTAVITTSQALEIVRVLGGAVVLTVSTSQTAFEIEAQVLEAGNHLGYLRLLAEELDTVTEDDVAGLLATVPVHVPVAVGSLEIVSQMRRDPLTEPGGASRLRRRRLGDTSEPDPTLPDPMQADLATRGHRWSQLIDRMLEHPLARAHRLAAGS